MSQARLSMSGFKTMGHVSDTLTSNSPGHLTFNLSLFKRLRMTYLSVYARSYGNSILERQEKNEAMDTVQQLLGAL